MYLFIVNVKHYLSIKYTLIQLKGSKSITSAGFEFKDEQVRSLTSAYLKPST